MSSKSENFKRIQRGKYILRPGFLDKQSKKWAAKIPQDSASETIEGILKEVENGKYEILQVYENQKHVGFTIFEVTDEDWGKEFLSILSYGKSETDLTNAIIPMLEGLARAKGCKTIRLHTMRPGLSEKLIRLNWFVSEVVLRKTI